ncbi:siderophore-interacting protein [Protaetiibacter sp. SSC-01]|uniref:siderophore-interacting protein n=1 Tax=Protaetiibacter sp. SSC-01 TaxID=2759943 RepID=UPI001656DB39|nr:siderophore-interacting protein [Protaetiibacter sp. SSC-01]QNO38086.1 siderophore-interacting protein [Protaetiibacter sp. SSC-01]
MSFRDARSYDAHALLEVVRREQVTPHMVRVTVAGDDLADFPDHGFDHWFRLFLPRPEADEALGRLPRKVDIIGTPHRAARPSPGGQAAPTHRPGRRGSRQAGSCIHDPRIRTYIRESERHSWKGRGGPGCGREASPGADPTRRP